MKPVVANVLLWSLAIAATAVILPDRSVFTTLGPLYAVCMIGSVVIVRRAQGSGRPPAA